jgi:ABC-2 type transport system permease protein
MAIALTSTFSNLFDPARLFGPIFEKELRVSSRRKRNYTLRFAYILLLSIFILSIWYSALGIRSSGSIVYMVSRLSQTGKQIITAIVWFQFIAAQLIAIVMLSSSVSDEIHTGTLSVLMTTPISNFQIVTGKLLSKLLQLMLLLAISLPLLAIIRVFGGVPWDYIVASVCITLTAAVLAGALSLMLSMIYRHSYTVILMTILGYLLVFGALAGLFNMLAVKGIFIFDQNLTQSILALINPFVAFAATNARLLGAGLPMFYSWPAHCLIMWCVTAVLIAISVWRVRKAALGEAFGRPARLWSHRALKREDIANAHNADYQSPAGHIKRVTGSPIVWKEMRKGLIGHTRGDIAIFVLLVGLFFLTAVLIVFGRRWNILFPYYLMSGMYLVVMIRLAVLSAGSIAGEKQARTWPILLMTPLEDKEIIWGKASAAIRRNGPLLLLYPALFCISYILLGRGDLVHMIGGFVMAASGLVGSVLFITGSGSYFGVRLRSATAAVVATVGSYLVIAYLLCGTFNPLRILLSILAVRARGADPAAMLIVYYTASIIAVATQAGIGVLLARHAARRLRHHIF